MIGLNNGFTQLPKVSHHLIGDGTLALFEPQSRDPKIVLPLSQERPTVHTHVVIESSHGHHTFPFLPSVSLISIPILRRRSRRVGRVDVSRRRLPRRPSFSPAEQRCRREILGPFSVSAFEPPLTTINAALIPQHANRATCVRLLDFQLRSPPPPPPPHTSTGEERRVFLPALAISSALDGLESP